MYNDPYDIYDYQYEHYDYNYEFDYYLGYCDHDSYLDELCSSRKQRVSKKS